MGNRFGAARHVKKRERCRASARPTQDSGERSISIDGTRRGRAQSTNMAISTVRIGRYLADFLE